MGLEQEWGGGGIYGGEDQWLNGATCWAQPSATRLRKTKVQGRTAPNAAFTHGADTYGPGESHKPTQSGRDTGWSIPAQSTGWQPGQVGFTGAQVHGGKTVGG